MELFVDLDGLARVAAALDDARHALESIESRVSGGAGPAEFGDVRLADAHNRFLGGTRAARVRCAESLDACTSYVRGAVRTYGEAEGDVLSAVRRP